MIAFASGRPATLAIVQSGSLTIRKIAVIAVVAVNVILIFTVMLHKRIEVINLLSAVQQANRASKVWQQQQTTKK